MTNIKYVMLQACYWMVFCVCVGFISLYLQAMGLADVQIGIATAIFCGATFLAQPMLGNLSDHVEALTWKRMVLALTVAYFVVCVVMIAIPNRLVNVFLLGALYFVGNLIAPFINTAHYHYSTRGIFINFGVARGAGSAAFAMMAFVIGSVAQSSGPRIIPVFGAGTSALLIGMTLLMPYYTIDRDNTEHHQERSRVNTLSFLRKYPTFSMMLFAVLLMYFSHNLLSIYLLQVVQSLGGDSTNLGSALALQAAVEIPVLFGFSVLMRYFAMKNLMLVASFGYVVRALMYLATSTIPMLYVTQLTQMCSFAILAAASVYYTGIYIEEADQNTGQAFMTSMMPASTVLASLAGGSILEYASMTSLLVFNLLVTVCAVGIAVISVRMPQPHISPV
ncbi:MFS transporter [Arcanobacterium phocisimile]|uniref:MFS transporter n=1 Tax=Arcanobacterium phocisimile TaxID=1302235 RepID=A0ABX7IIE6_9ACTO|nr:MFS transporter [Arcanobacterium phocisimile]QRV02732.1 MFS transporter [Arcanobacterium phocisimile]